MMDDRRGGFEAHPLERRAIAQILWLEVVGLLEELVGTLVVLARLSVLAFFVGRLGLIGDGRQNSNHDEQHYCRGHQTSHSSVLVYKVFAGHAVPTPKASEPGIYMTLYSKQQERLDAIIASRFPPPHVIAPTVVTLFGLSPSRGKQGFRLQRSGFGEPPSVSCDQSPQRVSRSPPAEARSPALCC